MIKSQLDTKRGEPQGYSRSSVVVPIDTAYMTSYSHLLVT